MKHRLLGQSDCSSQNFQGIERFVSWAGLTAAQQVSIRTTPVLHRHSGIMESLRFLRPVSSQALHHAQPLLRPEWNGKQLHNLPYYMSADQCCSDLLVHVGSLYFVVFWSLLLGNATALSSSMGIVMLRIVTCVVALDSFEFSLVFKTGCPWPNR